VRECEEGADDELGECYKGSFVGVSIDVVLFLLWRWWLLTGCWLFSVDLLAIAVEVEIFDLLDNRFQCKDLNTH
jgi:hypothetical protein